MQKDVSPIEEGTFSKGGINRQPMTPRPDFVPAPLGKLTPIGGSNYSGPREANSTNGRRDSEG
jgi:hypothetical protein